MTVLIAGAGLAGLSLGLTLHQIGVPFRIYESAAALKPLGVGINIQPNAARELIDLGLEEALEQIAVRTRELGFFTKTGRKIWTEPRGTWAGYTWPQYSAHRGQLQMTLYEQLVARAGKDCVVTGQRATGFGNSATGAELSLQNTVDQTVETVPGSLVIAADGIHSAIRKQMQPGEGEPIWGGAVLWRGTTRAPVYRGGGAMCMLGHDTQRVVAYPITNADAQGLGTINWIAEITMDPSAGWNKEDWNRRADINDFLPAFTAWKFDWLDVPALIQGAGEIFEYPMVDRDPIDCWTDGRVTLIGDAAHPTYPVGSNGASQAILDARILGAQFLEHGVTSAALQAYEAIVRPQTSRVTLANRGSGPDAIMQKVEDLCGGDFKTIDQVISNQELADHAAKYKSLAGVSIEELNARPALIPAGARIATRSSH